MRDFSEKHRGVVFFGLWAEEGAESLGKRDAWEIVIAAAKRTREADLRKEQGLSEAMDYLESHALHKRPYSDFRNALNVENPDHRVLALHDALRRIRNGL